MIIDVTDNFPALNKFVVVGDTEVEALLEKVVGYLLGFSLLAVGFSKWLPVVITLKQTEKKLKISYESLTVEADERRLAEEALKLAKENLERQNDALRKLDRIKDGLISDVTHELKTPIAKQAMQIDLLQRFLAKHDLLEESGSIINIMESSIKRQESVIQNILNLTSLEEGGRKYQLEPLRMDKLLEDVLNDYQSTLRSFEITVKKELPKTTITSDIEMLLIVFSNLVNNSIKYRQQQGSAKIEISLEKIDDKISIRVADNGIGLTEEEQLQAFERFYQASVTSEGSGIGLSISKIIISDLGGEIWLDSKGRNEGTTVAVELPLN